MVVNGIVSTGTPRYNIRYEAWWSHVTATFPMRASHAAAFFFLCHVQHNLDRRPPLGIGMGQTTVF